MSTLQRGWCASKDAYVRLRDALDQWRLDLLLGVSRPEALRRAWKLDVIRTK